MRILHEVNEAETTQRVYKTVEAMVESELLQQEVGGTSELRAQSSELSESSYLKIIDGKTARLFSTACALGNPEYEDFGLHYGRLFQLEDDLADGEANEYTKALIIREKDALATIKKSLEVLNVNG